jgi:hypothetical protein
MNNHLAYFESREVLEDQKYIFKDEKSLFKITIQQVNFQKEYILNIIK